MEFETIGGIQYKVGSPEHVQALRQRADADKSRADAKVTAEKTRADKAEGERDEAQTRVKVLAEEMGQEVRMDDVRLYAGEGKLTPHDVIAAVNVLLARRARTALPDHKEEGNG